MRTYEIVFISSPNASDDDVKKLTSQLEHTITDKGGKVTKVEEWGRRKLAYRIQKFDEGTYTIVYLEGTGQEVFEVERRLRVTDFVIRHLVVRTDEDLKRAAKVKAKRKAPLAPRNVEEDFEVEADDDDLADE